jgi:hypothetical protein
MELMLNESIGLAEEDADAVRLNNAANAMTMTADIVWFSFMVTSTCMGVVV